MKKTMDVKALVILVLMVLLMLLASAYVLKSTQTSSKGSAGVSAYAPQEKIEWRMVTTWPKGFPGLGVGAENFARMVETMSDGRLVIKVFGANEIVPAMGVFDVVSSGTIEMGHGASYYWKGKSPAMQFFTTVPFGMTAQEANAWLHYGGGMELWRELYSQFNVIPLAGGNSGVQMAGWFNREIHSINDIRNFKMRIPGIAGEVFEKIGGTAVNIPGGDLYIALSTGVIDAMEWVVPYNDIAMGFHEVAKYYYYPGWHEPGSAMEFIINKQAYAQLPDDLKAIVASAARVTNHDMLDELTAKSSEALRIMVEKHNVQLRRFPDDVLIELKKASDEVLADMVKSDPFTQKVYDSYSKFYKDVRQYHLITESAYINARELEAK